VQPAHFAERHGLIVIIAIGEAVAAIGFGARNTGLGAGVIIAMVLGLVVAASFWLAYFDFFSAGAQRLRTDRRGEQRVARDAYRTRSVKPGWLVGGLGMFVGHQPTMVNGSGPAFRRARVSS
jgi:low temperature requirement A protein (LtrA)